MDDKIVTAVVGLVGLMIGAWLNATLTTRREQWNLRRELYTRLLENLGEIVSALEPLYNAALSGPGRSEKERKYWDDRVSKLLERETHSEEQIRRAASVSAVMLSDESIEALKIFQKEWEKSFPDESWDEHIGNRLEAARKAYSVLVLAAKKDLFRWHSLPLR